MLNSQYDSVTGSTAIEIKEHPADNLAPNTRKMAPSASLGLRAGDDELDPPIDESLSANDGQEASESAGQVDSDQLGSIDSDATRAKESLPSFSKEELDDSAVHIAHPYYSDDANDAAGIPGTPEIRKDGTTENAEQDFDHPKDPTHEVSAIEEEVLIGSQPKGTSSESHEKSSNGQVTAIESLKETSDGYAGRNEDQAVTQINYLDPQSSTIVSTAEEDVISYDEEDDFDLVSDQEGEGNLQSLLSSPSTSTKRSHDATEDQGAPDDGLQGISKSTLFHKYAACLTMFRCKTRSFWLIY